MVPWSVWPFLRQRNHCASVGSDDGVVVVTVIVMVSVLQTTIV